MSDLALICILLVALVVAWEIARAVRLLVLRIMILVADVVIGIMKAVRPARLRREAS